jgi:hypothetical protein
MPCDWLIRFHPIFWCVCDSLSFSSLYFLFSHNEQVSPLQYIQMPCDSLISFFQFFLCVLVIPCLFPLSTFSDLVDPCASCLPASPFTYLPFQTNQRPLLHVGGFLLHICSLRLLLSYTTLVPAVWTGYAAPLLCGLFCRCRLTSPLIFSYVFSLLLVTPSEFFLLMSN